MEPKFTYSSRDPLQLGVEGGQAVQNTQLRTLFDEFPWEESIGKMDSQWEEVVQNPSVIFTNLENRSSLEAVIVDYPSQPGPFSVFYKPPDEIAREGCWELSDQSHNSVLKIVEFFAQGEHPRLATLFRSPQLPVRPKRAEWGSGLPPVPLGRILPWYIPAWLCSLFFPALMWTEVSSHYTLAGWWVMTYAISLVVAYVGSPAPEKWYDALFAFFVPGGIALGWLIFWRIFN